eukprot:6292215-Pyramimonas_sp.AAC.1
MSATSVSLCVARDSGNVSRRDIAAVSNKHNNQISGRRAADISARRDTPTALAELSRLAYGRRGGIRVIGTTYFDRRRPISRALLRGLAGL